MADPLTLAVVGATAGAVMNRNDPIKGALIGGTLGYGGGALASAGAAYGAVPGVAAGGQQAAMLAAQTGEFGLPGLLATGASGATATGVNPATASLFNLGSNAMLPGTAKISPMQSAMAGSMLMPKPPQQPLPRAPQIQSRPYTGMRLPVNAQEEEMKRRAMYAMPTVAPISLI